MNTVTKKILIGTAGVSAIGASLYFLFKDSDTKLGNFIRQIESKFKNELPELNDVVNISGNLTDKNSTSNNEVSSINLPKSTSGFSKCLSYKKEQFPLKKGMKGNGVKAVQKALNDKYNSGLDTDGCFGRLTQNALYDAVRRYEVNQDLYMELLSENGKINQDYLKLNGDII